MADNKAWINALTAGTAVVAVATVVCVWQRMQGSTQTTRTTRHQALGLLHEFQHAAATPLYVLRQISEHMAVEMRAGLMTEGKSSLLMLPTFVEKSSGRVMIAHIPHPLELHHGFLQTSATL